MNWLILFWIVYVIILVLVCLRVIYDTRSTTKTLAYLLFVIFVPVLGMIFYFSFGVNYRKHKIYTKKLSRDDHLAGKLGDAIVRYSRNTFHEAGPTVQRYKELAYMLVRDTKSALTANNSVKLLINGEQKFPEVLKALENAKNHIHIEYYIYEDDDIGRAIEQILIKKAKEGVTVRFIYDDFGSRSIRRKLVGRLKAGGVQVSPFYRIIFLVLANRLNYRNHRKIIVVDGNIAFVGGINVSDRYINKNGDAATGDSTLSGDPKTRSSGVPTGDSTLSGDGKTSGVPTGDSTLSDKAKVRNGGVTKNDGIIKGSGSAKSGGLYKSGGLSGNSRTENMYWRDTHLRIEGPGANYLQYLFLCDWNFCADDHLEPNEHFFPRFDSLPVKGSKIVQIAGSGPDSDTPTILFSLLQAINLATDEILISTPYFIPGESMLDALIVASLGGIHVKLLVPGVSDSAFVNAAARSYYDDLLAAGVEVYRYRKGFLHAKTMVVDKQVAIVGTANMDYRSFDLNFEVNAIVYDEEIAQELAHVFYEDIKDAEQIDPERWRNRPKYKQLIEKTARLVSPLL